MALFNTVASVREAEICALRRDTSHVVIASSETVTSSFNIGGWDGPLGTLLNEVMLDGAIVVRTEDRERPPPRYHDVARTQSLARRIDEAWANAGPPATDPDSYDGWIRSELGRAHDVVRAAASRGECVLTVWEFTRTIEGLPIRVRALRPGEDPPRLPLALPPPLVIAGCIAGGILAAALWRARRMRLVVPRERR